MALSEDPALLQRAYVLLGQLVHSYAHGADQRCTSNADALRVIPRSDHVVIPGPLAVPFHYVCESLGLPPVLTAAATDLWNWTVDDVTSPSEKDIILSKLQLVSSVTGTTSESAFHLIPCAMQVVIIPAFETKKLA